MYMVKYTYIYCLARSLMVWAVRRRRLAMRGPGLRRRLAMRGPGGGCDLRCVGRLAMRGPGCGGVLRCLGRLAIRGPGCGDDLRCVQGGRGQLQTGAAVVGRPGRDGWAGPRPTGAAAWRPPSRTVVHSRPRATAPPWAGSKSGGRSHVTTPPTQIPVTSVGAEQLSCGRSDPRL